MRGYQGCYQRAYRCLGAAAEIWEDQRSALLTDALAQKLDRRARSILRREVPRKKGAVPGEVKAAVPGGGDPPGADDPVQHRSGPVREGL